MGLIARLPASHSVRNFRRAARLRYSEANRAVTAGDRLIGIYLAGYAAEMTLKATYFRITGRQPTDPISMEDLYKARTHAKMTLGLIWRDNLHNLNRWGELIVEERRWRANPIPMAFASRISTQIIQVANNWREDMRYPGNQPRSGEVVVTFEAVRWLLENESRLVR